VATTARDKDTLDNDGKQHEISNKTDPSEKRQGRPSYPTRQDQQHSYSSAANVLQKQPNNAHLYNFSRLKRPDHEYRTLVTLLVAGIRTRGPQLPLRKVRDIDMLLAS